MSDTFLKVVQDVKNNTGTVLGAKFGTISGNLVEVKIFSLTAAVGDRAALWNQLQKAFPRRPYKLLEPYTIQDSKNFFGRHEVLVDVLTKLMSAQRFVLIFGRAGIGKTSLIDAGLAPAIIQQGGLLLSISNYHNPAESIQQALKGLTFDANEGASDVKTIDEGRSHVANTDERQSQLRQVIDGNLQPGSLILVLDQFELIFEPTIKKEQRDAFIDDLKDLFAAFSNDPPKVIIVARDEPEVKAGLAAFQTEFPDLFKEVVDVPLLDEEQALRAINAPLLEGGDRVQFASADLVKTVAKDLANPDGNGIYPPHLQIVCCWLYQQAVEKPPFTITSDLLSKGDFSEGIIAKFLTERLDNELSNVRDQARELLDQLASPGQERWVSPRDLTLPGVPAVDTTQAIGAVLDKMVAAKLLYRNYVNNELRYGFIDAGMVKRVRMLKDSKIVDQHRAGEEMERMWQAWLERGVFATSEQLEYISRNQSLLQLSPVRILFLLRSAMERREDAGNWVRLLRTRDGIALISALEKRSKPDDAPAVNMATLGLAWKLLTTSQTNANGAPPRQFNSLAEGAADGPDDFTRATAALALMSKDVGSAVGQIQAAIGPVNDWAKKVKSIKLRGAMVEADTIVETDPIAKADQVVEAGAMVKADAKMKDLNSALPFFQRISIFVWLVRNRAYYRDAARILRITAGVALCTGLLVGAWGWLFIGAMIFAGSTAFSLRFTYGVFFGGAIALGLALIKPLLQVHRVTGQFTGSPAKAALIICTMIFGVLHWAVFFGSGLPGWQQALLISMGFLFGSGIGLGVVSNFDQEGSIAVKSNWGYIFSALIVFSLVPVLFFIGKAGGEPNHLRIVSGGSDFASTLVGLSKTINELFVHSDPVKTIPTIPRSRTSLIYHFVSAIDTIVTGLLFILGFKFGIRLSKKL